MTLKAPPPTLRWLASPSKHYAFLSADGSLCKCSPDTPAETPGKEIVAVPILERHRGTWSTPKISIPVFTIVGIAMAIVHHELYTFLDGKPVNANFGSHGQAIVPALGTFIAYVGHISLAVAIGDAFVQVLWRRFRTRRQGHSIQHINALVSCQRSPFTPSSLRAWSSGTFSLAFIAALANFMAVITIWAPGALSIIRGEQSQSCFITVPDLAAAHVGSISNPTPNVISLASRAVIQGYLPPYKQCNQTCHFNVEYVAPALQCTNTTSSVNFATSLPPGVLWNSSYTFNSGGLIIQAAMLTNSQTDRREAVNCTAFNATYLVRMDHSNISSTATLLDDPELHNQLTTTTPDPDTNPSAAALGALADALAYAINGSIHGSRYQTPGSVIQYTWMVYEATQWGRTQDLTWILPSLMQNVSLSVASGLLDLQNYPPTMTLRENTCYYAVNVYAYNDRHLLLPYGICAAVSLICGLRAFFAISHDGDEYLDFTRILGAIPRQGLTLTEGDWLEVEKDGLFTVVKDRTTVYSASTAPAP